jgi:DNA invertase Pin-like site-specific DNA recombinase
MPKPRPPRRPSGTPGRLGLNRGRQPSFTRSQLQVVWEMLGTGAAISAIADGTGLSRQTIDRIKVDYGAAEAVLAK